jgi:magnesium-transporting ATPase (P-type)
VPDWHTLDAAEALSRLGSDAGRGLSQADVERQLREYGPNALVERGAKSPWLILRDQLTSVMVIVLIVAGVISVLLKEYADAAAILAIVILNAALGFFQEHRAERAMQALRRLAVPVVKVRRDGRVQEVSAQTLVPGDLVLLEAGSHVPADGRLVEAANLRIQEAALTGESEAVEKTVERMEPQIAQMGSGKESKPQITQTGSGKESAESATSAVEPSESAESATSAVEPSESAESAVPLGDRRNMAYMGTAVVSGRGAMVVTETGMKTELGRIADMIQTVKREPTPLQKRLEQLARGLAVAALAVVAIIFALGLMRGEQLRLMFMVAISMAVAAVPEGLPAVVTIALTLGARRMLARKALIRRLAAVETLGSVTDICSDKTGTLTQNRMTVRVLDVAGHTFEMTNPQMTHPGSGEEHKPQITQITQIEARQAPSGQDGQPQITQITQIEARDMNELSSIRIVSQAPSGQDGQPQITQITQMGSGKDMNELSSIRIVSQAPSGQDGQPQITQITQMGSGKESAESVKSVDSNQDSALALLLAGVALCNDAVLEKVSPAAGDTFRAVGDPTEAALVVAAAQAGLVQTELARCLPRVSELAFSSERKRMTTVHRVNREWGLGEVGGQKSEVKSRSEGGRSWEWGLGNREALFTFHSLLFTLHSSFLVFTKGAVDVLLGLSDSAWVENGIQPMNDERRSRIEQANDRLAQSGMRVLGLAFKASEGGMGNGESGTAAGHNRTPDPELERGLVFVGMVGMIDPPRPEVKEAVALCRSAGIRPVMITGDHPLTAQYIAEELGIAAGTPDGDMTELDVRVSPAAGETLTRVPSPAQSGSLGTQSQLRGRNWVMSRGPVLTGAELGRMSAAELETVVEKAGVYARVAPEHKLSIVEALQRRGHVVAMTGDGVNDAPALKKADIGVAMGVTGTDVAKEAADMVLLDDNFATIVAAVREGRAIYDNIRKFIRYILSANAGEISVMLLAPFLGMPLPLLPLQILWINLVTDGLPGLALSVEPPERDVMKRPPRNPKESIFGRGLSWHVLWVGLLMAVVSLAMGYWAWRRQDPGWQTMVFFVVTMSQLFQSLAMRSSRESFFRLGLRSNPWLAGTVLLTLALQLAVIYVPFMQTVFGTVSLSARDLGISLVLSTGVFWGVELGKLILRRGRSRAGRERYQERV